MNNNTWFVAASIYIFKSWICNIPRPGQKPITEYSICYYHRTRNMYAYHNDQKTSLPRHWTVI